MFAVLWLASPRDAALRRRLTAELIGVLVTHVPRALEMGRALRRAGRAVAGVWSRSGGA
jgi:hypothetical protein